MNGYFIDGQIIKKGEENFFEQGVLFSPRQLKILCEVLNSATRFDETLHRAGGPYWDQPFWRNDVLPAFEQECERQGVDITPPWRKRQTGKRCRVEYYDRDLRRAARCRKRADYLITEIRTRKMALCDDHCDGEGAERI